MNKIYVVTDSSLGAWPIGFAAVVFTEVTANNARAISLFDGNV